MVTLATREGPLQVPDATVRAIAHHAQRQADLTAAYFKATGLLDNKSARFPAAFLLELAAVLELGLWERQHLRRHLDVDVPTYCEAVDGLAARCGKGLKEFNDPDDVPFSRQVLSVWLEHFAWDGPELLDAEVVLGDTNEDDFIDLLAEFVWTHRSKLKHLLQGDQ